MIENIKVLESQSQTAKKLSMLVNSIQIDPGDIANQEPDLSKVEWYKKRFEMFAEDGVPAAMTCYLTKLQREDVNDITRAMILYEATNKMLQK